MAVPLLRQTLRDGRPEYLHALFDAGAGRSDADVRALWQLVAEHANLDVTLRACRYPHRLRGWKQLPAGEFTSHEEPGRYQGAPPKELRLGKTDTVLKGATAEQAIRTILCREIIAGPKKDRWHPLFTTSLVEPAEVLDLFRSRQHHEQAYRVGVYDEALDAVPCGYDKNSPDPRRPRFHRGAFQLVGWLLALVYNALADFSAELAGDWDGCHIRTLRRTFLNRPGLLYGTPRALIVQLEPFAGQEALVPVLDRFNHASHTLPWLGNRRLIVSLRPRGRPTPGP